MPSESAFARRQLERYGQAGAEWLRRLPSLLAECAARWSLTLLPPFEPLSYNYVAPAVRADGTPAVVKAGVPNPELSTEIAALRVFDGRGIVRLLDGDADRGVLLLERLEPGTPLSRLEDDERATRMAAQLMRRWSRPAPEGHAFPTLAKWARGFGRLRDRFGGRTGPLPARLVEPAEGLYSELLDSAAQTALLHGDLHHDNILSTQREPWLALDPKGVVGDPAFEVAALLHNPRPRLLELPNPGRVLARRVDLLAAELGFERERLIGWGVAQSVLSAWWTIEDHGHGWEPHIAVAERLASLR